MSKKVQRLVQLNEQDRGILVKDHLGQLNEMKKQLAQKDKEMDEKIYLNN